jgi:hypothetical protein
MAPTYVVSKIPFSTDIKIVPTVQDSHPDDQGSIGLTVAENVQVQEDDLVSTKSEIIDTVPPASIVSVDNVVTFVNGNVVTSNSVLGASTAVTQALDTLLRYVCMYI